MIDIHELKIMPEYFEAVLKGIKKFELRHYDRNYKVKDILVLKEWKNGGFTGRKKKVTISYILKNVSQFGLKDGYAILGWK